MKPDRYILLILLTISHVSCIHEIEWKGAETTSNSLVVEGLFTDVAQKHVVKLSRTLPVAGKRDPLAVSGAQVSITDGNNLFLLTEEEAGIYVTESDVKGEVGKKYTLNIQLDGEGYTATDSIAVVPDIDAFEYETSQFKTDFYTFALRGNFGATVPFKYRIVYRIPDDASSHYPEGWTAPDWYIRRINENEMEALDTTYYIHDVIEPAALLLYGEHNRDGILRGSLITEYVYSVSDAHYKYIRALLSETEWRGTGVVGNIPADVQGNVSNGAKGFFATSSVRSIETEIQ